MTGPIVHAYTLSWKFVIATIDAIVAKQDTFDALRYGVVTRLGRATSVSQVRSRRASTRSLGRRSRLSQKWSATLVVVVLHHKDADRRSRRRFTTNLTKNVNRRLCRGARNEDKSPSGQLGSLSRAVQDVDTTMSRQTGFVAE